MALGGYLCDGGSTHHSTDLLAHWALGHRTTLPAHSCLHLGIRGDALQSQSSFSAGIIDGHFTHGDNRSVLKVNPLDLLCV